MNNKPNKQLEEEFYQELDKDGKFKSGCNLISILVILTISIIISVLVISYI